MGRLDHNWKVELSLMEIIFQKNHFNSKFVVTEQ